MEEVKALGVDAIYVAGSVGNADDVRCMAGEALEHFKAVNIVVNNASIRPQTPFADLTEDEWHHVIGVDLHSAFYTAKAFSPGMIDAGWGRIVNLTGMNAMHGYAIRPHVSVSNVGSEEIAGQRVWPAWRNGKRDFTGPYRDLASRQSRDAKTH